MNHRIVSRSWIAVVLALGLPPFARAQAPAAEAEELPVRPVPNLGEAAEFYFSPDGKSLIGNAKREGDATHHVYTTTLDGSKIVKINDQGEDACSFYFPDGKRLLWTSTRDHLDLPKGAWSDPKNYPKGSELYVSDLEGRDIQRLTNNMVYDAEAAVSPDGKWILFGRDTDGKMDLWVMNSDGTDERQITFTEEWQEGGAQFMPDSDTILTRAWKREDEGQRMMPMQIFTLKRDGSGRKQITSEAGTNWAPFPAPDGKHFAFVKILTEGERPNWEIFMMNLETGKQTRLTRSPAFDGFPSISPDGKWLTFSSGRNAKPGERTLHQYLMDISSLGVGPVPAAGQEPSNLSIGDPARRDRKATVVLDGIIDTATGEVITPRDLAVRLGEARMVFVGENHTSTEYHNVQRRLIEELTAAGREVLVGLEMYPYTEQTWLDEWTAGRLSEEAFLRDSRWYRNWGYHWLYYRDIFTFSRDHRIRMFGVNTPREVISAVRKKGFQNLTPEEAARIPSRIDTTSEEHRRLFKAYFSPADSLHTSGMTNEQFDAMYNAQATWDATMGYNAVQALQKHGGKDAIMVVLIGSGHVAYGLGAERQARLWFDGRIASVIPVAIADEKGEKPVVRASYANFIWGVAPEKASRFPTLGISTGQKKDNAYPIIAVQPDSVAARAGFKVGDTLISMDGVALTDREITNRLMAGKRWGDSAEFKVRRGSDEVVLKAYFRRTL